MKSFPFKSSLFALFLTITQIVILYYSINLGVKRNDQAYYVQIPLIQNIATIIRLEQVQGKDIEQLILNRDLKNLEVIEESRDAVRELIKQVHIPSQFNSILIESKKDLETLIQDEKQLIKFIEEKNWQNAQEHFFNNYFISKQQFTYKVQQLTEAITNQQQLEYKLEREKQTLFLYLTLGSLFLTISIWIYVFYSFKSNQRAKEQAEQELQYERGKTIQNAKLSSLGEMAAGIAHEINNPLAIISSLASAMISRQNRKNLDEEYLKKSLDKIVSTSFRIAKIIKSLRDFSRDGSRDPFDQIPVKNLIDEVTFFCEGKLKAAGVEFSTSLESDFILECRSVQIQQIILNLISNATDAIQQNSEKWVKLTVVENADSCYFLITDSGLGISAAVVEKMMQPFFTTKEVGKGTGLGLSVSSGIAQSHGGSLIYDSSTQNTTFKLTLPKKQNSANFKTVA